ncbi:response regulator transcription factor [Sinanaerobacter chloroacetimidivorans]|uniref:Stage 0 sporulation protein A homolog n=1 Tax=Sinanaerobacter chloroacetimidivorans TaxID=2818044 RepID=A0A8J8AZT9_9FIRM|nr:response regulator transcription factor [Sinanaerobacter chloroacetimidivorans]MBR0596873.1 response regulator transcription factor [Sinanaerobacter chloroacetimidivorans]
MQERILIIEDEEKLARFVELELAFEGYVVEKAMDGRTGLALAQSKAFDLIALDIMLPGLNGLEVLRRIRQTSSVPVIMLTARDATMDKVAGLDAGANDYITKPFAIEELLARIRAVLRNNGANHENSRQNKSEGHCLVAGELVMNPDSREVWVKDTSVDLTKREFDLLAYLLQNKGLVMSRERLLDRVWGYDFAGETNAIDVYIRYLRAKIEEPFGLKIIQTIRGVGYVIREE